MIRGKARFLKGDYNQAISDFSEALSISNSGYTHYQIEIYYNRGMAYAKLGEHNKAIADLTEAINKKSKSGLDPLAFLDDYYKERGNVYKSMGDQDNANDDFKSAENVQRKVKRKKLIKTIIWSVIIVGIIALIIKCIAG
jgi:tetratricopeptide (TPR) repeat protein